LKIYQKTAELPQSVGTIKMLAIEMAPMNDNTIHLRSKNLNLAPTHNHLASPQTSLVTTPA
jgi:hypothetical protein